MELLLIAASLCSVGWHDSYGMIKSVVVGFLYILNLNALSTVSIVMSK
jgi:hypothetical protein